MHTAVVSLITLQTINEAWYPISLTTQNKCNQMSITCHGLGTSTSQLTNHPIQDKNSKCWLTLAMSQFQT